ncbi:thioredoxin superfamily protein [Striga asiatica]|uniref:Thioredoxin superfamily protein n=1 Tax=Striga asiatica TaxID=4170 RepID=A0A5A7PW36_STRAF|nr:thioredoxin superfamily protein [Striga asiatica]
MRGSFVHQRRAHRASNLGTDWRWNGSTIGGLYPREEVERWWLSRGLRREVTDKGDQRRPQGHAKRGFSNLFLGKTFMMFEEEQEDTEEEDKRRREKKSIYRIWNSDLLGKILQSRYGTIPLGFVTIFAAIPIVSAMENSKVQEVIEQQVLTVAKAVEDKIDDEIAALERLDLDDIEVLRERRLQQMKKMAEKRRHWVGLGHGEYSEIPNEKEFFSVVKASERVVCHFYRENWPCKVVDKHLSILAKQHIETRFVKINAEKSPYLSEKLRIVVLPTLALVKNAKVEDYVVGFDELGGTDDFSTEELEERLAKAKVIFYEGESSFSTSKSKAPTKSVRQGSTSYSSDSE